MPAPTSAIAQSLAALSGARSTTGHAPAHGAPSAADVVDFDALLAAQLGLAPEQVPVDELGDPARAVPAPVLEQDDTAAPPPAGDQVQADPAAAALLAVPAPVAVPLASAAAVLQATPGEAAVELEEAVQDRPRASRSTNAPALREDVAAVRAEAGGPASAAAEDADLPAVLAAATQADKPQLKTGASEALDAPAPRVEKTQDGPDLHPVPHERPHEPPRRLEGSVNDQPVRPMTRTFADDIGQRVVWMASNGQQAAELRVDPPQLGPVEVRLTLSGDQASLTLLSPHASVRDALQTSLPRLQEMLVGAGIDLGSVHVGSHAPGQQPDGQPRGGREELPAWLSGSAPAAGGEAVVEVRRGLVDTYA